jgi:glutathione S-transferase
MRRQPAAPQRRSRSPRAVPSARFLPTRVVFRPLAPKQLPAPRGRPYAGFVGTNAAPGSERTLVVLRYSPYSERARWALDHHSLRYRLVHHEPFIGERRLRRLIGDPARRATVPVLVSPGVLLTDSWDIALHADRIGGAEKLVPEADAAAIAELRALADEAMNFGRVLVTRALLDSNAALDEVAPRYIPHFLRPLFRPVARYGTRWFGRKYALDLGELEHPRQKVRSALARFREQLGQKPYLLGHFSYADILVCSVLQGIRPPEHAAVRLRPASRAAWTQVELAAEFEDLLAWRDTVYRDARPALAG